MDNQQNFLMSLNLLDNRQMVTYRVNSGAARFHVRFSMGRGIGWFTLSSKDDCHKELYKILLDPLRCGFVDTSADPEVQQLSRLPEPIDGECHALYITWFNNKIIMGVKGQAQPFLEYENDTIRENNIGYINFNVSASNFAAVWNFEAPLPLTQEITSPSFEDGQLKWKTTVDDQLPPEAMIGGFENEPIYIARANHRGSLCPRKFVPSKQLAFVPWGHREHSKDSFEILCGYNARWIKTKGNYIPDNAFIHQPGLGPRVWSMA